LKRLLVSQDCICHQWRLLLAGLLQKPGKVTSPYNNYFPIFEIKFLKEKGIEITFFSFLGKILEGEVSASKPGLYLPPMEAAPGWPAPEARKGNIALTAV
jgi:hypothetical protein